MKSAYEIAMERLNEASGPTRRLTPEQKACLAEIDKKFDARVAEARLRHEDRSAKAASAEEYEGIQTEMAAEIQSIEAQRQREKDEVWEKA